MSKASNLERLRDQGFPVPAFVVIPACVFDEFRAGLPAPLTADAIVQAPMLASLRKQILDAVLQLPDTELAIRSSMRGEDSERYSFAGQLDSFLNVRGPGAVVSAVRACWASAYGERASAYRKEHNLPQDGISMEVIAQVMVPAHVSGVIFTADPAARDPRRMVISAAAGLGEALVQGQVQGDTYAVTRSTGTVDGVGSALTREQIGQLVDAAGKIEEFFGGPQDIEFAMVRDKLFILQARPITTPISTEYMLWDNSNITESYSGVTTPLTFSVVRDAYAQVYRQFLGLMGVRHMDEVVLRNLLGLYHGQIYYQLLNWYNALSWLPAFDQNRQFMEQMMGVKQSAGKTTRRQTRGQLALLRWGLRMIRLHLTSRARSQAFLANFHKVLAEYQAQDMSQMTPHALRRAYLDLETRVLGAWRTPIVNDFFAMIFFGVLSRLSQRWIDADGTLHNDLLTGEGNMESIEPVRRARVLAHQIHESAHLQSVFELAPEAVLEQLKTQPELAEFRRQLDDYLRLYGDRCMNELKLEEPNLRDDPLPLIRIIGSLAKNPVELADKSPRRAQAEARISRMSVLKRVVFRWVLDNARQYIRNRENLRFARSRLFGMLRRIFHALGDQWAENQVLERTDDIFYLSVHEIWDFVAGTAVTQNLKGLVALRRAEYGDFKSAGAPLPDRFETFGIPYLDLPRDTMPHPPSDSSILQGMGCCSGQVRGRAQVVKSANEVSHLGGDILVAERTDPGWIFLYPSASGILVERGSPLSHSVIVARELGKPIVVNIPNLTARVKTGAEVELDGGRGTVRLFES